MTGERILFVTGRFAEEPLRGIVDQLAVRRVLLGQRAEHDAVR